MSRYRRAEQSADCLAVDLDRCTDEGLRECADVLYGTGCPARGGELLRRYPGCLLVTLRGASGGCCRCPGPPGARPGRSCVAVVLRAGVRGFVTQTAFRPRALSASEHGALAARLHGLLVGAPRPG